MKRVAVFVDAGYLFAQGSIALTGTRRARSLLALDGPSAISRLEELASAKSRGCEILRTYWYDGASFKGPTIEQDNLAHLDNVKMRLGFLNSAGEQKGVDSLIVTDLIELARLGAICDAVLVSGDEDVRVGVQIAQNYGVRVHLVGITPARGSQSKALLQEADTTTEWDRSVVERFLSLRPTIAATATIGSSTTPTAASIVVDTSLDDRKAIAFLSIDFANSLDEQAVSGVFSFWSTQRGVPQEYDGKLLGLCRSKLGRDLTLDERRHARTQFSEAVRSKRKDP